MQDEKNMLLLLVAGIFALHQIYLSEHWPVNSRTSGLWGNRKQNGETDFFGRLKMEELFIIKLSSQHTFGLLCCFANILGLKSLNWMQEGGMCVCVFFLLLYLTFE